MAYLGDWDGWEIRCGVCGCDCQSREECEDNVAIQRQAKREAADRMAAQEAAHMQYVDLLMGGELSKDISLSFDRPKVDQ